MTSPPTDSTSVSDATDVVDTGDRLRAALAGRYTVDRAIGRGGMAFVFRAHDVRHDRDVAIKVLKPTLAAALGGERFLREIRYESRMQHPHILPLYDSGEAGGLLYYVMPLVEGETLRDRLSREGQLPVDEVVRITSEVGDALAYAHTRGVIHRDIKPENILLASGHAYVADFGIAQAVREAGGTKLTETGLIVGTPTYMSPEQAGGQETVDARSDIYSLGCVVFEMLVGGPPFTGRTAQAIMARHLHEAPPSVEVVRPATPLQMSVAIQRSLAKVPADRFATMAQFLESLAGSGSAVLPRPSRRITARQMGAIGITAVLLSLGTWLWFRPRASELDPRKVVLFPLRESGLSQHEEGAGYGGSIVISAAFDHASPLQWIDAIDRLTPEEKADPSRLTPRRAQSIARDRRARYYLDGLIHGGRDSTTVSLRLHDAAADTLVAQQSATAGVGGPDAYQLALTAVRHLLPALLDPGRSVELRPLMDRKPEALALWIDAERAYRAARFTPALALYRNAVREDSALVVAAVKGAQAASWTNNLSAAEQFIAAALNRDSLLPPNYAAFARALGSYLTGQADSAVARFRALVTAYPDWAEAHMAFGEVVFHLLPGVSHDSLVSDTYRLAGTAFRRAAEVDPGFTLPLVHLAEMALRSGDQQGASAMLNRLVRADPDSTVERKLQYMTGCVAEGPARFDWQGAFEEGPTEVLNAAKSLSAGGAQAACAEAGFRTVYERSPNAAHRWAALVGLQGIMVAQGRFVGVDSLLDGAVGRGLGAARMLYFLNTVAGAPLGAGAERADSALRLLVGDDYAKLTSPQLLWLVGAWRASRGDVREARQLLALLETRAATGNRQAVLLRQALDAHVAAAERDTTRAIAVLRSLVPTARRDSLEWELGEGLAAERLLLARLLASRGSHSEALRVASVIDHQGPVAFLPFLAPSLALRSAAERALRRPEDARVLEQRLLILGRADLARPPPQPVGRNP